MKTLKDVKIGDTAKVVKLHGEGPVKRRIMDMGITKGVEVYVHKVTPYSELYYNSLAVTVPHLYHIPYNRIRNVSVPRPVQAYGQTSTKQTC